MSGGACKNRDLERKTGLGSAGGRSQGASKRTDTADANAEKTHTEKERGHRRDEGSLREALDILEEQYAQ